MKTKERISDAEQVKISNASVRSQNEKIQDRAWLEEFKSIFDIRNQPALSNSFQRIVIVFFTALAIGVISISVIFYGSIQSYKNTSDRVQHTQTVLDEAKQVSLLSKDLQLESNGYFITGDSSFILSYNKAKTEMAGRLSSLKELTSDNPFQQQNIHLLGEVIHKLITSSDASIQNRNFDSVNTSGITKIIVQRNFIRREIQKAIDTIRSEEQRLLRLRLAANNRSAAVTATLLYVLAGFVFILLVTAFFVTFHYFKKRKKAEGDLRESEARFHLLINNIKDFAIFLMDANGTILNWYSGAENIKGFTREEVIGKPISIFYTPEDIAKGLPAYNLKMATEKGSFETEGWRVRKDGSAFWADVVITAIYDKEGQVQGFTKVTRDYTLHKKAEDEILNNLEKEKELNEMKSNFVSMASHEFRTPLSSILSSVSLIEQYTTTDQQDKRARHIKRIKTAVADMVTILEEFLSLEKMEEGKVTESVQTFNIKEGILNLISELKNITKTGQSITYAHTGREQVTLDPSFVRHILTNLISNAIKYSPENSPVIITTQVVDETITIHVKDRGMGISKEDQKHLFERFFRASNASTIQGTGLGLHIIKRYVDMMNGRIRVNSEPGQGSEFIIEIKSQQATA